MGAEASKNEAGGGLPAPTQVGRFDEDEVGLLRAALDKGGPQGLSRSHFAKAFGSMLPTSAVDRLFASMACASSGDGGESLHVPWDAWVDGIARVCKPSGNASDPGASNATRLGVLWDLTASTDISPSETVVALDKAAALEVEDDAHEPKAGALDERCVLTILVCCARHCADERELGGAEAMGPLVRDALLAGPLSRHAWVRWASACVPLLGEVFELLIMRGVAQLAGATQPAARALRLAEERWLPKLVGLGGDVSGGSGSPSLVLSPALTWAISLSIPQPASGAVTDAWRLLYSSAEHGLSQNRLSKHVVGYAGPTLLVVSLASGLSWAAYIDTQWTPTDAGRYFGGDACSLFLLAPRFHAFRATHYSTNYCAFVQNVRAALGGPSIGGGRGASAADEEMVGFGGAPNRYRCQLTNDLTLCTWRHSCSVYQADTARLDALGIARDESEQRVSALEVWGLGGVSADSALLSARAASEKGRAAAGRVNRAAFGETWHDSPDKMIMELGGHVFHSDQLRQPERPATASAETRFGND